MRHLFVLKALLKYSQSAGLYRHVNHIFYKQYSSQWMHILLINNCTLRSTMMFCDLTVYFIVLVISNLIRMLCEHLYYITWDYSTTARRCFIPFLTMTTMIVCSGVARSVVKYGGSGSVRSSHQAASDYTLRQWFPNAETVKGKIYSSVIFLNNPGSWQPVCTSKN